MFLDFTHKPFFFWKLLTNFNSCSAKRYFFGKPKLHPNSIIHSSLYYMTNFSIAGCLKIKTIATTKMIIYLFIYLFILESRRRKLKSKMADKRQYGGFVSQDEDGLLLWTYGTTRLQIEPLNWATWAVTNIISHRKTFKKRICSLYKL